MNEMIKKNNKKMAQQIRLDDRGGSKNRRFEIYN
jgi:hypothetical protein